MQNNKDNKKKIAKNTIALYLRTLLTMLVGLYTSRVILNVLGVDNFGIYNVVGGVVAMFSIITSSLSQAISRYITFDLGKQDYDRLKVVFSTSVNIQVLISVVVVVFAEIFGVWFLNNKMNITQERMFAANWVFQFAVFSFVVTLISVPFNAAIIAHEKMKAFAYVGVLEAVLKLLIAYALYISAYDKLITYAFLLFIVSIVIRIVYGRYCSKNFKECVYTFVVDKKLLKEMFNFAAWNFISGTAYVFNTQGLNILSNMFFGVAINAARGIATQVDSVTKTFVYNFTTAVKPQIVKSYSSGNYQYMNNLVCMGAKYSYFLMLALALPFIFESDMILKIWLKNVPPHVGNFVKLTMVVSLVCLLGDTLYTSILAIGKLRKYMIYETLVSIFVFPVTYLFFLWNFSAEVAYIVFAIAYFLLIFIRLFYLKKVEEFPIKLYIVEVFKPILLVSILSSVLPLVYKMLFASNDIVSFIVTILICEISFVVVTLFCGLSDQERAYLIGRLNRLKSKLKMF